jgi:molybdopterin molybdotransferase
VVRVGENVRRAGEDVDSGSPALPAGTRLGPRQLALLAAVGVEVVEVVRRPRVSVLSIGDELRGGLIPDSNGVAVAGLCRAVGAVVERAAVPPRLEAVAAAIEAAAQRADLVMTIGGVSVGDRELVPAALARLGAEVRVHGVPMKPGKPFLFASLDGAWVAGLPGSPSACLAAFEVFARPALLTLAGAAQPLRPALRLRLAEPVSGRPGRARLVWAALAPDGRARLQGRDTAQISGPAQADLLLLVPASAGELGEGEEVGAWLLDER